MNEYINWTKEEYAKIHWDGVRKFIAELEDSEWSDRDKLYQVFGYLESYMQSDKERPYEYEVR